MFDTCLLGSVCSDKLKFVQIATNLLTSGGESYLSEVRMKMSYKMIVGAFKSASLARMPRAFITCTTWWPRSNKSNAEKSFPSNDSQQINSHIISAWRRKSFLLLKWPDSQKWFHPGFCQKGWTPPWTPQSARQWTDQSLLPYLQLWEDLLKSLLRLNPKTIS